MPNKEQKLKGHYNYAGNLMSAYLRGDKIISKRERKLTKEEIELVEQLKLALKK